MPALKEELEQARLSLHWATQVVAAAGSSFVPTKPDFSHTALSWSEVHGALLTEPLPTKQRIGIQLDSFRLVVIDENNKATESFEFSGRTLDQSLASLNALLPDLDSAKLKRPEHDLPDHPVREGAAFEKRPAMKEIGEAFSAAHTALSKLAAKQAGFGAIRIWPHHFDMAALLPLDPDEKDSEKARSIGAGFTPGDGHYNEPYYYVSPWPYPKKGLLPTLTLGHWHQESFTSAILTQTEMAGASGSLASAFLASTVQVCVQLA